MASGPLDPNHARALRVKHEPDGIRPRGRAARTPSSSRMIPQDLHPHRRAVGPIALVSITRTPHAYHGVRQRQRIAIPDGLVVPGNTPPPYPPKWGLYSRSQAPHATRR